MFYFFHHVPKCGGTSFNAFLKTIFTVHEDYSYMGRRLDPIRKPEEFQLHVDHKLDLSKLGPRDCVAGHFGHPRVFLWERYPELATLPHRKFTIIRDPFEAAKSGVRFAIKRGNLPPNLPPKAKTRALTRRAKYYSRLLNIHTTEQIEEVMATFWLVAPLQEIGAAARIIAAAVGKPSSGVDHRNSTEPNEDDFTPDAEETFRAAAALDCAIYEHAVRRYFAEHGETKA